MLNALRAEFDKYGGALKVGYTLNSGGGGPATIFGLDEIGVALSNEEGRCFYPWSAIRRIRITEGE